MSSQQNPRLGGWERGHAGYNRAVGAYVGTSGYSYKEWKGSFYPEDIKPADMLGYYASRLDAVEINNTFYRLPSEKMVANWASQVPADFRFVLKASRRITHFKRLKDAGGELEYFLASSAALGDKRGPLLFQLPPFLKKDAERLKAFVGQLPEGVRAAFEFRHPSWFDDEIFTVLRDAGTALVVADTGGEDDAPLVATAPYGYLRLRRPGYSADELAEWTRRIAAEAWDEVFIFFKHEDEGAGPKLAAQCREQLEATKA